MAQRLRALAAFPEVLSSIPSNHKYDQKFSFDVSGDSYSVLMEKNRMGGGDSHMS